MIQKKFYPLIALLAMVVGLSFRVTNIQALKVMTIDTSIELCNKGS